MILLGFEFARIGHTFCLALRQVPFTELRAGVSLQLFRGLNFQDPYPVIQFPPDTGEVHCCIHTTTRKTVVAYSVLQLFTRWSYHTFFLCGRTSGSQPCLSAWSQTVQAAGWKRQGALDSFELGLLLFGGFEKIRGAN